MCCHLNCGSLHFVSRSSLNMLWIAHPFGSSSWNTPKLMSFEILKDLYLFWSSFFEGQFDGYSCFPTTYYLQLSILEDFIFSYRTASSIDFVACFQLFYNPARNSSNFGNSVDTTRLSFYRCLSKSSSKGVLPVAVYHLSLYWNSAATNHSVQSSCW